jgi:hypothetical protein
MFVSPHSLNKSNDADADADALGYLPELPAKTVNADVFAMNPW